MISYSPFDEGPTVLVNAHILRGGWFHLKFSLRSRQIIERAL